MCNIFNTGKTFYKNAVVTFILHSFINHQTRFPQMKPVIHCKFASFEKHKINVLIKIQA